ncbi:MAG: hypothetical protein V4635_12895 [Bacteroidota bacterium]
MEQRKKILSILIKLLVGIGSFVIIYLRLKSDFTSEKLALLYDSAFSNRGVLSFVFCLLLIPVNWGIEAYKWMLITAPVEKISYKTATKSVYSGVCLGNLAPGRATEFLAKIIFFKPENRSRVTVLHFVGGMFQLSITIISGLIALLYNLNRFAGENSWMAYLASGLSLVVLVGLFLCVYNLDYLLNLISKLISKKNKLENFKYPFSAALLTKLFSFSVLRYAVFFSQMFLLISIFYDHANLSLGPDILLYFLITTIIPMISVLEAPIRAAIALVVFKDSGLSDTALALSSVLIWLVNIIVPSVYGYIILLQQNFNFKLSAAKK